MLSDSIECRGYIRVDGTQFNYLLEHLSPIPQKEDTNMRKCIDPAERICLTLRYLATGESFHSVEYQFRISRKAISYIVMEVRYAISKIIGASYLTTPKNKDDWLEISQKFYERWNFPNGIGALDGKHIVIQQPENSGSHYRNYKGTDSIILMVLVGPEYEFLYADIGINGRNSDGGVWDKCKLKEQIEQGILDLPDPVNLPGRLYDIPFVIAGDDALPLTPYLMKPYPMNNLTDGKRIYNYRFSRMRRISENGFGILANRFRVFRIPPALSLHNWLRSQSNRGNVDTYGDLEQMDNPTDTWFPLVNGSW